VPRPRSWIVAVACVLALLVTPLPARADTTADRIERARAAIDDLARRWFDNQATAALLDAEIAALEERVADARAEADERAVIASAQAVELYTDSGPIDPVLDAQGALDTARRAELLDRANAEAHDAIDELNRATEELEARRAELQRQREEQERVAAEISEQQAALEAELAALEAEARQEASRATARQRAPRSPRATQGVAPTAAADRAASPPTAAAREPLPAEAAPAAGGETHPRHDEPFLVCTRERESRHDYSAVNPAGYYGAYQFAPTTWDVTASRAGRLDLVGVLPSEASPYDQDELAWVLFEWQGNRPWNGRC